MPKKSRHYIVYLCLSMLVMLQTCLTRGHHSDGWSPWTMIDHSRSHDLNGLACSALVLHHGGFTWLNKYSTLKLTWCKLRTGLEQ